MFTQEDNARDLLQNILPQKIRDLLDLRSIKVEDTSVIDSRLSERQSDILIRTSLRESSAPIYILVEHKSYPDRWTVFQLTKYMVRIWEKKRAQHGKGKTLPPIIPVIFYHGARRWRSPLNFCSYFIAEDGLRPYIPEFHPVMVDLQQIEERSLQGSVMTQVALITLKHSLGNLRPYLEEILRRVLSEPMDERNRGFLSTLLEYIIKGCKDVAEQDVEQAILSIGSKEAKEAYMTLAEQLIDKGKREGELEGKLLEKQEVLLKLLTQKFGALADADKRKIKGSRDPDKLDQAIGLILKSETTAEVLKPLD